MSLNTYALYQKFLKFPFGKNLFSLAFCLKAPYFFSIRPTILEMKPGAASVKMNQVTSKRKSFQLSPVQTCYVICFGRILASNSAGLCKIIFKPCTR